MKKILIISIFLFISIIIAGSSEDVSISDIDNSANVLDSVKQITESVEEETKVDEPEVAEKVVDTKEDIISNNIVEYEEPVIEFTPEPEPVRVSNFTQTQSCHSGYSGCLRSDASDYDCEGGSGDGPYYTGKVKVYGSDPFRLDRDGDGWGCE